MEIFNIIDLSVFYEKRFDGGGTTFGFNSITKSNIIDKIQDQGDVLEICSGPGFIGYTLLKYNKANRLVLSDINPEVRDGIETTNRFNNLKVEFIQSDCFDSMEDSNKFDTIVSNPPHFKTERPNGYRSSEEKLISLDYDMQFHKKFFESAHKFLNPNGKVVLIENCDGVTEEDIRVLSNQNFSVESVDYDSYGWEGKSTFYTIILKLID